MATYKYNAYDAMRMHKQNDVASASSSSSQSLAMSMARI